MQQITLEPIQFGDSYEAEKMRRLLQAVQRIGTSLNTVIQQLTTLQTSVTALQTSLTALTARVHNLDHL